jgi:hypothetical protein
MGLIVLASEVYFCILAVSGGVSVEGVLMVNYIIRWTIFSGASIAPL